MRVKVYRYVIHPSDVGAFLRSTGNYGKRFYTKTWNYILEDDGSHMENVIYLDINAIAVSRDLIYKIHWEMKVEEVKELVGSNREYHELEKPWNGLLPVDDEWIGLLYPFAGDEVGASYVDCFAYEAFTEMDTIEIIEE